MNFLKRQVPIIIVFVSGMLFVAFYFIPLQWSQNLQEWILKWLIVISSVALLLGVGNLLQYHYVRIKRRIAGWGFSMVALVGFTAAVLACFVPMLLRTSDAENKSVPMTIGDMPIPGGTEPGSALDWMYNTMILPMGATMFAIIGFFIASASFRAFRARSLEATLLLIAAIIIMLGQTPLGGLIWSGLPDVMTWILTVPTTAAKRAIIFGIALGSIAFSLRIILGIERSYLGGKE